MWRGHAELLLPKLALGRVRLVVRFVVAFMGHLYMLGHFVMGKGREVLRVVHLVQHDFILARDAAFVYEVVRAVRKAYVEMVADKQAVSCVDRHRVAVGALQDGDLFLVEGLAGVIH